MESLIIREVLLLSDCGFLQLAWKNESVIAEGMFDMRNVVTGCEDLQTLMLNLIVSETVGAKCITLS